MVDLQQQALAQAGALQPNPQALGGLPSPFPDAVTVQPLRTERHQTQTATPAPGQLEAIQGAAAGQRQVAEAQQAQGAAETGALDAAARAKEDMSVQERLAAQDVADRMAAADQRRAAAQSMFDEESAKLKAFQFHEYFDQPGTGNEIVAYLGAALGAGAATMSGGPNFALQQINSRIANSFARQRAQLDSQEHRTELARRGVQDVDTALDRELAALELKEAHARKATAAYGEAIAVRAGIPVAQAKNDALVAQTNSEADAGLAKALSRFERHAEHTTQTADTAIRRPGGAGSAAARNLSPTTIYGDGGVPIGDAQTPKQADEVNEKSGAYRDLRSALLKLKEDMDKNGVVSPIGFTEASERRKTMAKTITGLLKKQEQLGTLDNGVERLVNGVIGGTVTMTTGTAGPKLDEAIGTLDERHGTMLEQHGFRGGRALVPKIHGVGGAPAAGSVAAAAASSPAAASRARITPELLTTAIEALRANSGASEAQRAKAQAIVDAAGSMRGTGGR